MIRDERYLVLKHLDILHSLDREDIMNLGKIIDKINSYRRQRGKERLDAVVVESDWPMYEDTWKLIEEDHDAKRM